MTPDLQRLQQMALDTPIDLCAIADEIDAHLPNAIHATRMALSRAIERGETGEQRAFIETEVSDVESAYRSWAIPDTEASEALRHMSKRAGQRQRFGDIESICSSHLRHILRQPLVEYSVIHERIIDATRHHVLVHLGAQYGTGDLRLQLENWIETLFKGKT